MNLIPYVLGIGAVCFYSLLTPLSKKFQVDVPPFAFVAISSLFLGTVSLLCSVTLEREFSWKAMTGSSWKNMAIFSMINFIGYIAYLKAVKGIPAANYQLLYILSPVFVAVFAYFLLHEKIELRQIIGFVLMGGGLCVAIWPRA